MSLPIYLDYMATTPVDPLVLAAMSPYFTEPAYFANPSSTHFLGDQAREAIHGVKAQMALELQANSDSFVFTSGATEANNLALLGLADYYGRQKKHIITVATEHKAVLDPCLQLAKKGFELTVLPVQSNGLLDLNQLADALRHDTLFASVMVVNNEIGVIQPIKEIAELVHRKGALLHVDAVQALGKIPVSFSEWQADLVSLSAHKCYGPKGIGLLLMRSEPKLHLQPQITGGGQQRGLRAGTLPTPLIMGFAKAVSLAMDYQLEEHERIQRYQTQLFTALMKLDGIIINGDRVHRVAHNVNISIEGVHGDALRSALYPVLAVSSSSACNAISAKPSHVLTALGRSAKLADAALRLSAGRFTTQKEVDTAIEILQEKIQWLRQLQPR